MAYEGWLEPGLNPPLEWERALAMDVGGASPNALIWVGLDPAGYVVACDEVYKQTTDMRLIADMALPKMKAPDKTDYTFRFKAGDYENRVALADMGRYGITFNNAVKHNKMLSVQRLSGYLHPNPRRPFPSWHPNAGRLGSPLLFITPRCKNLIRELPQQKWKEGQGNSLKDEMDRTVSNHTVDCLLYIVRMLPPPVEVKITAPATNRAPINRQSAAYWEDVKKRKDKQENQQARHHYRASHVI